MTGQYRMVSGYNGRPAGFTLIELLTALLILSLLGMMSYRGLNTVLDARAHVRQESEKWHRLSLFLGRFERDIRLAAPRSVRTESGALPAWRGQLGTPSTSTLQFTRFASVDGPDTSLRLAYEVNDRREIEFWLWSGLDVASEAQPSRYPVLTGVDKFELSYLDADLAWVATWPNRDRDTPIPLAVKVHIVLATGEDIVRVFALNL